MDRAQHHALVDGHVAAERALHRREHLVERRGGQESESAEIHAENRNAEVTDRPSHREERAVPTQDHDQVDAGRKLGLGRHAEARGGRQGPGFLFEDDLHLPGAQPVHQARDDRLGRSGLGDEADPGQAEASTVLMMIDSRSTAVRP